MTAARIQACGSYLPQTVLTNDDLAKRVDTSDAWIQERTGIKQRHIVAADENALTMAITACQRTFQQGNISPDSVDLIVCSTSTPVMVFPSTASLLQHAFNMNEAVTAFDVSAACGGFLYAMDIAEKYIRSGASQCALVIGTEVCSEMVDWQDRNTCVLFGDGAGAMILMPDAKTGITQIQLRTAGAYQDILSWRNSAVSPTKKPAYLTMSGKEVYKMAVNALTQSAQSILAEADLSIDDVDWFIPHQANARIIDAIAKRLHLSEEKIIYTLQDHGNTSSASIPLAFDRALQYDLIQRGDRLLFQAIGGGMVWGSGLVTY